MSSDSNDSGSAASQERQGLEGPRPEERASPKGRRSSQGIRIDPQAEASYPPRRTVISALVANEPGVLATISGLVSRRQFNIESLTVGPTTNPETSRITIVIEEPEPGIRQVEKQLEKLVPVISVRELGSDAIRQELVICKVHGDEPDKVQAITEMYNGRTLDAGPRTVTVQITGDEQEINDAIDAYRQFGIRELARTGQTALARGEEWTTEAEEERYERLVEGKPANGTATGSTGTTGTTGAATNRPANAAAGTEAGDD